VGIISIQSTIVLGMILGILLLATLIVLVIWRKETSVELKIEFIRGGWSLLHLYLEWCSINFGSNLFLSYSYLALKSILPSSRHVQWSKNYFLFLSCHFHSVWICWGSVVWIICYLIPIFLFLLLPFIQILNGETKGFLEHTSRIQWGVMMFIFGLSHIAYMINLPKIQVQMLEDKS